MFILCNKLIMYDIRYNEVVGRFKCFLIFLLLYK